MTNKAAQNTNKGDEETLRMILCICLKAKPWTPEGHWTRDRGGINKGTSLVGTLLERRKVAAGPSSVWCELKCITLHVTKWGTACWGLTVFQQLYQAGKRCPLTSASVCIQSRNCVWGPPWQKWADGGIEGVVVVGGGETRDEIKDKGHNNFVGFLSKIHREPDIEGWACSQEILNNSLIRDPEMTNNIACLCVCVHIWRQEKEN